MKKRIITTLLLLNLSFLVTSCFLFVYDDPSLANDDSFILEETSARVGDNIKIVYDVMNPCCYNPDYDELSFFSECQFYGLCATGTDNVLLESYQTYKVSAHHFNNTEYTFTVPPKAVASCIRGKILMIKYPEILTYSKAGNKVTVTSEKAFFNIKYFYKEKAKLLLEKGYPLVWLDGKNPDAKSSVLENMSPLEGSGNYDPDSITPYKVTFTIPEWFKGGYIHIANENGFASETSWLEETPILKADFENILSKISDEDKKILQDNYGYSVNDDSYYLKKIQNEDEDMNVYNEKVRNIKKYLIKILRQADYYDAHVPNLEPDPDEEHAFFASKEKLIID